MAKMTAEKLHKEMLAQFEQATPEEMVQWLAEMIAMRKEFTDANFYHGVFKFAVERLYLKTLAGKW